MNCPLCGAALVVNVVPTPAGDVHRVECYTDKVENLFSHYMKSSWGAQDNFRTQIVVLPYVINYTEGDSEYIVTEVDASGIAIREAVLPAFKIPPMKQFIDKLKLLLLFS